MLSITQADITAVLQRYQDPYLQTDWVTAKAVQNITITDQHVIIDIVLGYPCEPSALRAAVLALLTQTFDIAFTVNISSQIVAHAVQTGLTAVPGIKNIIAVASGKGGVGKSTTAVNLALALLQDGARVGILDADIYGPNQPHLLGVNQPPQMIDENTMQPIMSHGLQSMSLGYLVETNTAMVWRGPMVTSALMQLLTNTRWQDLDYLVIDLPPGTGDVQLTMAQKIPVSGVVVVTTPQEISLLDVRKAISMFQKVRVSILGIIENMSFHRCKHCGESEFIFGQGGGARIAAEYAVPLLGSLPLLADVQVCADRGTPIVVAEPNGEIAMLYREIARSATAKLALQAKNYAAKFPKIVIEDN